MAYENPRWSKTINESESMDMTELDDKLTEVRLPLNAMQQIIIDAKNRIRISDSAHELNDSEKQEFGLKLAEANKLLRSFIKYCGDHADIYQIIR